MATYQDIKGFAPINNVDDNKVNDLVQSILTNGWQGAPILYASIGLVTGSHRLAALQYIDRELLDDTVLYQDIALDVTDIINQFCEDNDYTWEQLPWNNLSMIFRGTEIETYKDDIVEW
jgi:hypothetical protein